MCLNKKYTDILVFRKGIVSFAEDKAKNVMCMSGTKVMNIGLIYKALQSALYLIEDEYSTLCDDDMRDEYTTTIDLLERAIKEIKSSDE